MAHRKRTKIDRRTFLKGVGAGAATLARAMSSWAMLEAVAGQRYNDPENFLAFAPKTTTGNFRCFFINAEGWGTFDQVIPGPSQVNTIRAAYGQVKLQSLELAFRGESTPHKVLAFLDGKTLALSARFFGKTVRLESPQEIRLNARGVLRLEVSRGAESLRKLIQDQLL